MELLASTTSSPSSTVFNASTLSPKFSATNDHRFLSPPLTNRRPRRRATAARSSAAYNGSAYLRPVRKNSNAKIYKPVDSCLVVPPPAGTHPRAVVEFLGGAFLGAVPELTYSYVIELLAKEGFVVISVPYNVTFDHSDAGKQVYRRFNRCLDSVLASGIPNSTLSLPTFQAASFLCWS